jgi:hypothetical protein
MALLGHSVQLLFQQNDIAEFSEAWNQLGFEQVIQGKSELTDQVVLTDGQLIVTCKQGPGKPPSIMYMHSNVDGLYQKLNERGIVIDHTPSAQLKLDMPGNVDVLVVQQSIDALLVPSKHQNPLMGYVDALVVNVEDIQVAQKWAESVGFFVQEQQSGPVNRLDVFDGLFTISFRKAVGTKIYVSYVTDFDDELIDDLMGSTNIRGRIRNYSDGSLMYVELPISQELSLIVCPDDE